MKSTAVMIFLGVWMIFEIRDFYSNGGFNNVMAFNLLKIILIAILMCLIFFMTFMFSFLPRFYQEAFFDLVVDTNQIKKESKKQLPYVEMPDSRMATRKNSE